MPKKKINAGHQYGDEFDAEEVEFIRAVEAWKTANNRAFPRVTDLLAILKALGYRKLLADLGSEE